VAADPRGHRKARSQWRGRNGADASLMLESGGIVSKLYKVKDHYKVNYEDAFCATSSVLDAAEGKRHRETKVSFDRGKNKASYLERDVTKDQVVRREEIEVPNCVHDVVSGLLRLRHMKLDVGQSAQLPMSDGKKSVAVKVEAQEREKIKTKAGTFNTIRYEAFLFNGVLYGRKARVFVWISDDDRRVPVQIRLRLQFTIGTITLQLEKEERS
jgi:hypothetical protein